MKAVEYVISKMWDTLWKLEHHVPSNSEAGKLVDRLFQECSDLQELLKEVMI